MNGHTPLDIVIGRDDALASSLFWLEHSDRVILLVEYGGRTTAGAKDTSLLRLKMLLPFTKNAPLPAEVRSSPSSNVKRDDDIVKALSLPRRIGEGTSRTRFSR